MAARELGSKVIARTIDIHMIDIDEYWLILMNIDQYWSILIKIDFKKMSNIDWLILIKID